MAKKGNETVELRVLRGSLHLDVEGNEETFEQGDTFELPASDTRIRRLVLGRGSATPKCEVVTAPGGENPGIFSEEVSADREAEESVESIATRYYRLVRSELEEIARSLGIDPKDRPKKALAREAAEKRLSVEGGRGIATARGGGGGGRTTRTKEED